MKRLVISTIALMGSVAMALEDGSDARLFRQIFLNEVRLANQGAQVQITDDQLQSLHLLPDDSVLQALGAQSVSSAMANLGKTDIQRILGKTLKGSGTSLFLSPALPAVVNADSSDVTFVIVPGVFGEFIKTHAFEEIFEKKGAFAAEFADKAAKAGADGVDYVEMIENYIPKKEDHADQPNIKIELGRVNGQVRTQKSLSDLILAGETQAAGRRVRVIIFHTEEGSMESLGNHVARAQTFTRRLEKYLRIMGAQNLAFVGYSRGTVLGLEMLAQAKTNSAFWLKDVKAMISLSGVAFGSSLADSAYDDVNSPMHKIIFGIQDLAYGRGENGLEFRKYGNFDLLIQARNLFYWTRFLSFAGARFLEMNSGKSLEEIIENLKNAARVDPQNLVSLVLRIGDRLGVREHFSDEYNLNILRFRHFVDELLASVDELTTRSREQWWRTHSLPKSVKYYAITASMANPRANALELRLFQNPFSYGKEGNYDDTILLGNRADYEKAAKVRLNDSQVSVAQAAFLPEVIRTLNPKNEGLTTKFLGTAGTHHWGMALREVNKMNDPEKINGFPREALLRALAVQVMNDL